MQIHFIRFVSITTYIVAFTVVDGPLLEIVDSQGNCKEGQRQHERYCFGHLNSFTIILALNSTNTNEMIDIFDDSTTNRRSRCNGK